MKLGQGKIPLDMLENILSSLNISNKNILIGPRIGFDSAVIDLGDRYLVISTDPSLYIPKSIPDEFFAFGTIHFSASDVAVFGAEPTYILYAILFPPGIQSKKVERIISLISLEAKKIGLSIIGGHTGVYSNIITPVSVSTAMGFVNKNEIILPSGAKPGYKILLTKDLGLEFVIALSYERAEELMDLVGSKKVREFRKMYRKLTVINESLELAKRKLVAAMHDVTEGGLLAALFEMAKASGVGFRIYEEMLPISEDINVVLQHFNIDKFFVSSTGSLLAAVIPGLVDDVIRVLKRINIQATIIGEFTERGFEVVKRDGSVWNVKDLKRDEYAKFFEGG